MTSKTPAGPKGAAALLTEGSPVLGLARAFRAAGHEIYLVGGSVRDLALRRDQVDVDLATSAVPDETLEVVRPLADDVWLQGVEFGTVGARIGGIPMEITTFRTERYAPSSRHPAVNFESEIDADLSRRDFTVNAMAIRLPERTPVDPFGGMADLDKKILKTPIDPESSFSDDPLRMLRAFRFASQLEFKIAPEALEAIEAMGDQLETISAERIRDELSKLVVGPGCAKSLTEADRTGLTDRFLPELGALKLEQDPVHRHKDVFQHTLAVVERTDPELTLRLAALLHDIGKPSTREIGDDGVTFHHHEVVGAKMARNRLKELRYPNAIVEDVTELIYLHHRFHTYRLGWSDSAVRRYVRDAGSLLGTLNLLVRADCTTRNAQKARRLQARMDELEERIAALAAQEELDAIQPDLDGKQIMAYLGAGEGRLIGEAKEYLLEVRLEEGPIGADAAYDLLDAWARERDIEPAGERVPPKERKKDGVEAPE